MKQTFFLIATLMLNACMQSAKFTPSTLTPCNSVPKQVTVWLTENNLFQSAFGDAASYAVNARPAKWDAILVGTHPELDYLGKGKLRSKKYGWTLNVKYDPSILYENQKFIIIEVMPGLDHLFTTLLQAVYIVDKSTGKIVWKYKTSARQGRKIKAYAVIGTTLYFTTFKSKEIYCVNLQ